MDNYYKPKPLGGFIEQVLKKIGLEEEYYEQLIKEKWCEIVGESLSKTCRVKSFKNGKLIIEADSSTWRSEIFVRRDKIKSDINASIGKNLIHLLEVR